ncbi:unnamed protein product, partial [Closterium sp. NIES-65]
PPQQQRQGEGEWEEWEEQLSEAWLLPAGPRLRLYHHQKHPERPGLPDCAHYVRTGNCRFGNECRYNHPKLRVDATTACG